MDNSRPWLIFHPERIEAFLSTFTSRDKDLTRGFADLDLQDGGDEQNVGKNLKYMDQLVRTYTS